MNMITLEAAEEIYISIYHIGYSSQGESSLFILHTATKKVLYSMVIDCYEESSNETDKILDEWNLHKKWVLNGLDKIMREQNLFQGMYYDLK